MRYSSARTAVVWLGTLLLAAFPPSVATSERPLEHYAGSFELESGEVITGGPFIERAGNDVRFLYMDTTGLEKTGLFRRTSELELESVQAPGSLSIQFVPGPAGAFEEIVWTEPGGSLNGRRVFPHEARSLAITSEGGVSLRGRLLLPECPGPHPLVVLVGGSGPTTRWGGVFDTFFVTLGMAVLAYDKRGVGEDDWFEPDLRTLAADAASAVRAGARVSEIDSERVGIWASSQGGWVAPITATDVTLDFLIVRVGPGVSELEAILHETRQEDRQTGLNGIKLDHASDLRREIYGLAIAGQPLTATDALVSPYLDEDWYQISFGEEPISDRWSERWWHWAHVNMQVEPGPSLRRLDLPILWFLAEEDQNVPLVSSRVALERAFDASPGNDETLVVIHGVNHAFLVNDPDRPLAYASGFFDRMKIWLADRGQSEETCWSGWQH